MAALLTLAVGSVVGLAVAPQGGQPSTSQAVGARTPAAPFSCVVERLALPGRATGGEVNTGSPNGRYLAGFTGTRNGPAKPVRWDGTEAEPIPIDGSGEAQGVNDNGVVVGEGRRPDGRTFAWAYVGGKVVELPTPAGYTGAEASAVNAAGQVAGVLFAGKERVAAAVWQSTSTNARVDVLEAPDGAMAFGISDGGVVVGGLRDGSSAYQWDTSGRGSRMTGVAGTAGGGAQGVRGDWAYGLLRKAGKPDKEDVTNVTDGVQIVDPNVAVLWNLRTGRAETVSDGRVEAVNTAGQAVVNRTDGTALIREADGTTRPLPALADGAKSHAYTLSDDGLLAAGTSGDSPVRWSCSGGKK